MMWIIFKNVSDIVKIGHKENKLEDTNTLKDI